MTSSVGNTTTLNTTRGTGDLSLLTILKEQPQLYDLHTHLLGMGNAGFWVDTILMNPKIMPTHSTFCNEESVRDNLCPLIWCENKEQQTFGFLNGKKAADFIYWLFMESACPKETVNEFNDLITYIEKHYPFWELIPIDKPIYHWKLNQELLHRGLSFKKNFTYDVVLKLDDLLAEVPAAKRSCGYSSALAVSFSSCDQLSYDI